MALGEINTGGGNCPCQHKPEHTEIVGKVGWNSHVWAVCGAHLHYYQNQPGTYTIELFSQEESTMSGESHLHQCPSCRQESVECTLTIGDPECGNLRCDGCSKTKLKPDTSRNKSAGHLLSSTWVCVNGDSQPGNRVSVCPKCGAPRPLQVGVCSEKGCGIPISEYYPDRCWYGHAQAGSGLVTATSQIEEAAEDMEEEELPEEDDICDGCGHEYLIHSLKTEGPCNEKGCKCPHWNAEPVVFTCKNCDEEHDEEDNLLVCDARGCSNDLCTECARTCNCGKNICDDHSNTCQCCEETVCSDCRDNHGV